MGVKVITHPTAEPVSRIDCQRHLRLEGAFDSPEFDHPEDGLIAAYLSAAREHAEAYTSLSIAPQTLELALDAFPCAEIELPRGPVQSVLSVVYVDVDGAEQTVTTTDYVLDDYSNSAWMLPADGFDWPSTLGVINSVKVRYVAGFSLPGDSPQTHPLPKSIRAALLLILGHLYENRENSAVGVSIEDIPMGALHLLYPHRIGLGV